MYSLVGAGCGDSGTDRESGSQESRENTSTPRVHLGSFVIVHRGSQSHAQEWRVKYAELRHEVHGHVLTGPMEWAEVFTNTTS